MPSNTSIQVRVLDPDDQEDDLEIPDIAAAEAEIDCELVPCLAHVIQLE